MVVFKNGAKNGTTIGKHLDLLPHLRLSVFRQVALQRLSPLCKMLSSGTSTKATAESRASKERENRCFQVEDCRLGAADRG